MPKSKGKGRQTLVMWFSPKLSIQTNSSRLHVVYHARLSDEIVTQKKACRIRYLAGQVAAVHVGRSWLRQPQRGTEYDPQCVPAA